MEVGIYGLGRFGTFLAGQLAAHLRVRAWCRDPRRALPPGVQWSDEDALLRLPAVILCVSISALRDVLRRIAPRLAPGTLVMDTCSVKTLPVAWMEELLPPAVDILGTHPMFGPDSAGAGLAGLPFISCPVRIAPPRLRQWESFLSSLGLRVLRMSPREHDREAAFTQGITHYIGRVLAEVGLKESAIATLGYRRLLEIIEQTCHDSRQLFLDLQVYNPYTREMRERLGQSLEKVAAELDELDQGREAH